ncbi:MAG: hypothetical protein H6891_10635 [Brucellaceae bacterium]|nr:hypothetical protein [Brucellaceae bacterium]
MELQFIDPGRFRRELVLSRLVPVPDGAGGYAGELGRRGDGLCIAGAGPCAGCAGRRTGTWST